MVKPVLFVSLLAGTAMGQRWRTTARPTTTLATSTRPADPQATQALYGQCKSPRTTTRDMRLTHPGGGQTYTGPTRCPSGSYCKNIENK